MTLSGQSISPGPSELRASDQSEQRRGGWDAAWTTRKKSHDIRLYVCKGDRYVRFDDVDSATIGTENHANLRVSTEGS